MKQISLHITVCHIVNVTALQFTAEFMESRVHPREVESNSPGYVRTDSCETCHEDKQKMAGGQKKKPLYLTVSFTM